MVVRALRVRRFLQIRCISALVIAKAAVFLLLTPLHFRCDLHRLLCGCQRFKVGRPEWNRADCKVQKVNTKHERRLEVGEVSLFDYDVEWYMYRGTNPCSMRALWW